MRKRIYRLLILMIVYASLYSIPCNAQSADISVYLDGIQFEAEFRADVLNDRLLFSEVSASFYKASKSIT